MSTALLSSQSCHSLADWLCYIEQSHPIHQIELGLDRVQHVADKAQLHQLPGKTVLLAGTNGKGTTARCIEQMLLAQGASVGVYSSPHLLHFNERLRINGADVEDALWVNAFKYVETLRADTALTYFEFTTLAAFYVLRQQQVDYCIIEVGLGGRLDATNIIQPDVSVITTVDLDHQEWLGPDRETIGREKAGVFRAKGATVIAELQPPSSVLAHAAELNCQTLLVNRDYFYSITTPEYPVTAEQLTESWSWQGPGTLFTGLPIPAIPLQNAACCLAVLLQLNCMPDEKIIKQVLATISMPGRMQWLQQQPAIIVDVAHNPQSARYLAEQVTKLKPRYRRVLAMAGMLKDKDLQQTLLPLTSLFDQWHLVSLSGVRGATAEQLGAVLPSETLTEFHDSPQRAFTMLRAQLKPDELLVVFGSFMTVSAVLTVAQEGT